MQAGLLRSDPIVGALIVTTVVYSLLCFLIGFHLVITIFTIFLIAGNAAVSFHRLFFKGRFFRALFILNVLQLVLFALLQAQMFHSFGHHHYEYSHLPGWLDWFGLTAVHFFKAADFVDFIDAYDIELLSLKHRSVQAGIILFSMHIIVDVFLYGAIRHLLAMPDRPLFKAFIDSLIRFFKYYRIPMLIGVLGLFLLCLAAQCFDRGSSEYMNWFNGHFWIIENILITIDFGDAIQIFGWSIHHIKLDFTLATLSIIFRLIIGSYLLMLLDSVLLHLTGGFGRTPAACEEIIRSPKTSQLDKLVAVNSLGKYGVESQHALPVLVETLMKSGVKLRQASFDTILRIGNPAIPELVKNLVKSDRRCEKLIREALENLDPHWIKNPLTHEAIPDLIASLSHEDHNIARASKNLLNEIEPQWNHDKSAISAIPSLTARLKDGNEAEREAAAAALGMINAQASKTVYSLARALGDSSADVRDQTAKSLDRIDPDWRASGETLNAVRFLANRIKNEDSSGKRGIAEGLGIIGPAARDTVPVLIDLLNPLDEGLCESVCKALDRIEPQWRKSKAAYQKVDALAEWLTSETCESFDSVFEILGMFGSGASGAVPVLMKRFAEETDLVSAAAAKALNRVAPDWKNGPRSEKMRGLCIEKLSSKEAVIRMKAAEILGRFGPTAHKAVPHLKKALSDEDMIVKRKAMEALKKIGV